MSEVTGKSRPSGRGGVRFTLDDARRQFEITERDALGLCVFILNMEPGDILSSKFVTITKVSDDTFQIRHARGSADLIAELMTSPEIGLRREIFGSSSSE